ncbi:MAG TPA: c-type cytochrome [Candidatus Scatomorpha intestinipullorum]|nr:c-type cytochrome [Candidatus Scatomorpha intestinipullorum]
MKKLVALMVISGFCFAAENTLVYQEGAEIYKKCIACHGQNGEKVAPGSKRGITIGGMDKDYLVEQLKGYVAGTADNGGAKVIMYANMKNWRFTNAEIEAVSTYISHLPKVKN